MRPRNSFGFALKAEKARLKRGTEYRVSFDAPDLQEWRKLDPAAESVEDFWRRNAVRSSDMDSEPRA